MKKQYRFSPLLIILGLVAAMTPSVWAARVISTFDPGGADAEVRESAQITPRGTANGNGTEELELASRIASNRNSHLYIKFGVGSITPAELLQPITMRLTFRNNNLNNGRIEDILDANVQDDDMDGIDDFPFANRPNVAFDYYVLDPNNAGADWDESLIAYATVPPIGDATAPNGSVIAPGLTYDGDFATKDLDIGGSLTYLASNEIRSLARNASGPIENHIPVGEAFDLTVAPGSALHNAIVAAQATNHQTVTVVTTLQHTASTLNTQWLGFNYLFNPKELATLTLDTNYDNDTTNPDNVLGSPYSGLANTQSTPFAPQLILGQVPEPSTVMLVGFSSLGLLVRRRIA